jgi:hypothetical protein
MSAKRQEGAGGENSLLSLIWLLFGRASSGMEVTPLARTKWIDGYTTVPLAHQTGSESAPYQSPEAWYASLGPPSSADDSITYEVGVISPTAADQWSPNPQVWTIPPSRVTLLRTFADGLIIDPSFSPLTIDWVNTPEAGATYSATKFERFSMASVNMTLTDSVGSPIADLGFMGQQELGTYEIDTLDYSGMSNADSLQVTGCFASITTIVPNSSPFLLFALGLGFQADFECGASSWFTINVTNGTLDAAGAPIVGIFGATFLEAQLAAMSMTSPSGPLTFERTTFLSAVLVQAPTGGAVFDGISWASFLENGGTYSATTVVLVVGGFTQGAVAGAHITNPAGNAVSLALNGVGASAGFTQGGNWYTATALAEDTTITLLDGAGAGAEPGDTLCITRTDTLPHVLIIADAGTGTIVTLPADTQGSAVLSYNGTAWVAQTVGAL